MILAELEVFTSRPIAPTRRVALGDSKLPFDPPPGFGGIILGAVAARFGPFIDEDLAAEVDWLIDELERGRRIAQPRLRHRLQTDRVGLQRSRHQLLGDGEELTFALDEERGTPAQHVLCAIYAGGEAPASVRPAVMDVLRRGLRWHREVDDRLIAHLSGRGPITGASLIGDPVRWAIGVLALNDAPGIGRPARSEIQRAFRDRLRDAHPDHGGADESAAARIAELAEARRILLA
jgi:hypothetical protein